MCDPVWPDLGYPLFKIEAKAFGKCEYGTHEIDAIEETYAHPHDLYRAAHRFYKAHESADLKISITVKQPTARGCNANVSHETFGVMERE